MGRDTVCTVVLFNLIKLLILSRYTCKVSEILVKILEDILGTQQILKYIWMADGSNISKTVHRKSGRGRGWEDFGEWH